MTHFTNARLTIASLTAALLAAASSLTAPAAAAVRGDGASAADLEKARQELIERGYSPGPKTEAMSPQLQRALMLFQQQQGIEPTGRLDLATQGALDAAVEKPGVIIGRERILSDHSRQELKQAQAQLQEAERNLGKGDPSENEHRLEQAKHLLEDENYHAGRPGVMKSKREAELAESLIEEKKPDEAKRHLELAEGDLKSVLSAKDIEPTSRENTDRQNYLNEPREVRPGGEVSAYVEEKKDEKAGLAPKPEKKCPGCDQTTESGEWMKGAGETGLNHP